MWKGENYSRIFFTFMFVSVNSPKSKWGQGTVIRLNHYFSNFLERVFQFFFFFSIEGGIKLYKGLSERITDFKDKDCRKEETTVYHLYVAGTQLIYSFRV